MRVLAAFSWPGTGWLQAVRGMVMLLPARAAASSGAMPAATQRDRAAWRRSSGRRAGGVAARRGPSAAARAVCQARPQVLSLRIPPWAPANSRPSGAVPKARRWSSRRRARRAGMGMALVAPSGRCLRPRCSWLAPVAVQAVAVRGAAVSMNPPGGEAAAVVAQRDGLLGPQCRQVQAPEERGQLRPAPGDLFQDRLGLGSAGGRCGQGRRDTACSHPTSLRPSAIDQRNSAGGAAGLAGLGAQVQRAHREGIAVNAHADDDPAGYRGDP